MKQAWGALAVVCGLVGACSLGSPKEPLVPTPVDQLPIVPPAPEAATPAEHPVVHTTKLDSGLTLIRASRPGAPTVGLALVSRAAHPVETGGFEARGMVQALLTEYSSLRNYGFVGENDTKGVALVAEVLARDAPHALRDLVNTLGASRWPSESVAEARLKQRALLAEQSFMPRLLAREFVLAQLFADDPALAVARKARRAFIDNLSPDELRHLSRDLYSANQTALCVVGDDRFAEAAALQGQALVLSSKVAHPAGAVPQAMLAADTVYLADAGSYQAYIAAAGFAPTAQEADFPAMWLLDRLLGRMFTSAVNRELREHRTVSYHAGTSLLTSRAVGAWLFETAVDTDYVDEVLDAVTQQFQRILRGVTQDEFDRAKASAVAELEAQLETTGGLLAWLAWRFQQGLEATAVDSLLEQVRQLSPAAVDRVARTYLPERLGPIVIVGQAQYIRAQLQWSGYRITDAVEQDQKKPGSL